MPQGSAALLAAISGFETTPRQHPAYFEAIFGTLRDAKRVARSLANMAHQAGSISVFSGLFGLVRFDSEPGSFGSIGSIAPATPGTGSRASTSTFVAHAHRGDRGPATGLDVRPAVRPEPGKPATALDLDPLN